MIQDATDADIERMGGNCAICWGEMTVPGQTQNGLSGEGSAADAVGHGTGDAALRSPLVAEGAGAEDAGRQPRVADAGGLPAAEVAAEHGGQGGQGARGPPDSIGGDAPPSSSASADGFSLPCGHAFHHPCLHQWLHQCHAQVCCKGGSLDRYLLMGLVLRQLTAHTAVSLL